MSTKRKRPVKAATRHKRLKLVGITSLGGYDAVLAAQGGGCAICGRPPKVRRLNVDHDHITGQVRGLLCARCNRGLGWFSDSPVLLETAVYYLRWGRLTACGYRDAARDAGPKTESGNTKVVASGPKTLYVP